MLGKTLRITAALTLIGGSALLAQNPTQTAPDPAKAALIDEVFRLTKPDRMMQQMLEQMKGAFSAGLEESFETQVRKFDDPSKYHAAFQKLEDQIFDRISQALNWPSVQPEMAQLYSDTFTVDELSGMVAFYKSPAGQAVLQKLPQLMAKSAALGQQRVMALTPEFQKMMTDFIADIKKAHDANTAPAPKSQN